MESYSVYSSDEEETVLMASKISLQVFLPDIVETGEVSLSSLSLFY